MSHFKISIQINVNCTVVKNCKKKHLSYCDQIGAIYTAVMVTLQVTFSFLLSDVDPLDLILQVLDVAGDFNGDGRPQGGGGAPDTARRHRGRGVDADLGKGERGKAEGLQYCF